MRTVSKRGIQKAGRRVPYHQAADWRTRRQRLNVLDQLLDSLVVLQGETAAGILEQKVELITAWGRSQGYQLVSKDIGKKLDPETDLSLMLNLNMTVKQRRKLKKSLRDLGINFFASNYSVESLRTQWGLRFDYSIQYGNNNEGGEDKNMVIATMNGVCECLTDRVQILLDSGQLTAASIADGIRICVLIDKGGATTKMALQIANISNPNSPSNLMLVGLYTAEDTRDNLVTHFKELAHEIDRIQSVLLVIEDHPTTVPIVLFFCSDLKGVYAALGLKGASSMNNCAFCERASRKPGQKGKVGEFWKLRDSEPLVEPRTLERIESQSAAGKCSVYRNSSPLFSSIPIDRVIRSPLHIIQGVAQDLCLKKLHAEALKYDLQSLAPPVATFEPPYELADYSSDDDTDVETEGTVVDHDEMEIDQELMLDSSDRMDGDFEENVSSALPQKRNFSAASQG